MTEKVTAWRVEDDLRVGTEFGVQPFEGMDMLRFSRMEVDVFKQQAEVSELVRVLDVRSLGKEISDNKTVVKSAVRFNQGVGIADAGTAFALSLHAIDRDGRRLMDAGDVARGEELRLTGHGLIGAAAAHSQQEDAEDQHFHQSALLLLGRVVGSFSVFAHG